MDPRTPAPAPRIRGLTALGGERVRVELDDGSRVEAPAEAVLKEGLSVGDPLDDALRARLTDADLGWRARQAALTLLAVRARSRRELARRLHRKDFPERVIDACLDELDRQGLLDDAAFARSVVRDRVRLSPRGPAHLLQELRKRGVEDPVAETALRRVLDEEEVSVHGLAEEAALGWLRRQSDGVVRALADEAFTKERERARRRLHGYLARRGFRGSAAVEAMDAATDAARAGLG
jgi:regulatory protein